MKIEFDEHNILYMEKLNLTLSTSADVVTKITLSIKSPEATVIGTHQAFLIILKNKDDMMR